MPDLKLSDYMDDFKECLQFEKPYCQAECPFHIDLNDFTEKIKKENFNSAYKLYRNAVGFPVVVSHICHQPCKAVCPMKDHGGAIELRKLEEAAVEYATRKDPTSYNIPGKPGKVAIIGSGLAGLGALLRMATKKYEVHLFEKTDRIGGLLNDTPGADLFFDDIEKQLHHEKYEIHLNTEIQTREEINEMGFDVVFVATGNNGRDFGITEPTLDGRAAWFAGGALAGDEGVYSLAAGLHMGIVLESYIKTKNLDPKSNAINTDVIIDPKKITESKPTKSADPVYSKEEAKLEGERCLQCQCDFCRTYEDLTAFYDKWPLRIKDEVFATTLEGSSEVKATPAKRLMSTSNLTGITKAVCPKDIDLDNLILAGRQKMHRLEKAPWAFHDFWLRDMDHANSENAAAVFKNPDEIKSEYAFFPGCQLGASIPEIVLKTYALLLSVDERMGLLLRCCGAPALWSGDEDKHDEVLDELVSQWNDLGSPVLIAACPTCNLQLNKYVPEIKIISLYEYMDKENIDFKISESDGKKEYSIFDPCSTRENREIKSAVRNLTDKLGIENRELPEQSDIQRCCSFGGQPAIANPDYANYVTEKRISESESPYITYCINCRDSFVKAGKDTRHILELIFDICRSDVPTASERRDNRVYLKKMLSGKNKDENMTSLKKEYDFKLIIPSEIQNEMDEERILEEEVYNVMDFILHTNQKVVDPETCIHSGYRQIGYMTYWVSYKETADENLYEIVDVYNHRMEIELEAIWNGTKTDLEV